MKDNSTTITPETWKMHFLTNGTSGTGFHTDDTVTTNVWLRAHPDDVEVIPLCRIPPRQHSHEQRIEEFRAVLVRMLHMYRMMLEATHYRENITDARYIREMREAPLQALNILARYPHKEDEVGCIGLPILGLSPPFNVSSGDVRQPTLAVHGQAFHIERACHNVLHAIKREDVGRFFLRDVRVSDGNTKEEAESSWRILLTDIHFTVRPGRNSSQQHRKRSFSVITSVPG